jgi:hypothetical protein
MNLRRWILLGCMLSPRLGAALALSYYFGFAVLLICLVIAGLFWMDSF